ncbi:MAG TPA: RcnB family protein [Rhizomicrobium sp.]|jgi:Ni/Co efflux regulator RcnB|nr:RcnB family protein [Rhizomicrobium sp.]
MNRFIVAAAAACLLASSPAMAEHHDHAADRGNHDAAGTHVSHTTSTHHFNAGGSHVTRTTHTTHVNVIRGGHERRRTISRTTTHVRDGRMGNHMANHHAADVRSFRRNFTASHRYHNGSYRRPSGWYAHRWVYGERLPRGWYGRDYWIGDYINFGLIAPPDGYQWVRDGDDALLVDVDTGEVLQVEYGVFY